MNTFIAWKKMEVFPLSIALETVSNSAIGKAFGIRRIDRRPTDTQPKKNSGPSRTDLQAGHFDDARVNFEPISTPILLLRKKVGFQNRTNSKVFFRVDLN